MTSTSNSELTLEAFQDSLDAWGPNIIAWPREDMHRQAEALLQYSLEARHMLAEAQTLELRLKAMAMVAPAPAALREAILQGLKQAPAPVTPFVAPKEWAMPRRRRHSFGFGEQPWATGFAAALAVVMLGFVVGATGIAQGGRRDDPLDVPQLVYAIPDGLTQASP